MSIATAKSAFIQAGASLDHLSWSGIQSYKQCPRRFRFRYIDKTPEERTGSALLYGGSIHRAVESIHEARLAGQAIPGTDELVKGYESAWKDSLAEKPPVSYGKTENETVLREQAQRTLEAYRQHVIGANQKTEVLAIEHAARFSLLADAPPIEARLDLVEKTGDELIVTDFKTSRGSWNDEKTHASLGQVVLYAHAIMPMVRELNIRRVVTQFVVLPKLKKATVQVLTPRPEQTDVVRLKETVSDVWRGVRAGIFPRIESWACKTCPFKTACLGASR